MEDAFDNWLIAKIQWLWKEEVVALGIYWLKSVSHHNFSHGLYADKEQESWCIEFRMTNNYSNIVESLWGVSFVLCRCFGQMLYVLQNIIEI